MSATGGGLIPLCHQVMTKDPGIGALLVRPGLHQAVGSGRVVAARDEEAWKGEREQEAGERGKSANVLVEKMKKLMLKSRNMFAILIYKWKRIVFAVI